MWPNSKRARVPHLKTTEISTDGLRKAVNAWLVQNGVYLKNFIRENEDSKLFIAHATNDPSSIMMAKVRILPDEKSVNSFTFEIEVNQYLQKTGEKLIPKTYVGWIHDVGSSDKQFKVGVLIQELFDNSVLRLIEGTTRSLRRSQMVDTTGAVSQTTEFWIDMINHDIRNLIEDFSKHGFIFNRFKMENVVYRKTPDSDRVEYGLVDLRNVSKTDDLDFARRYNLTQLQWVSRLLLNEISSEDVDRIAVIQNDEYFPMMNERASRDRFSRYPGIKKYFQMTQLGKEIKESDEESDEEMK